MWNGAGSKPDGMRLTAMGGGKGKGGSGNFSGRAAGERDGARRGPRIAVYRAVALAGPSGERIVVWGGGIPGTVYLIQNSL